MTNVGERLEEVAASIVSVAFHADVYLGGEILMLMTQKDLVDIVKLVMQSNIALAEEYVDLTPTVTMKKTKTQIKFVASKFSPNDINLSIRGCNRFSYAVFRKKIIDIFYTLDVKETFTEIIAK